LLNCITENIQVTNGHLLAIPFTLSRLSSSVHLLPRYRDIMCVKILTFVWEVMVYLTYGDVNRGRARSVTLGGYFLICYGF